MDKLDRYDRIILQTLQDNGRASNVELSDKANLSAPQCYRRVRRLEADGIIRGYAAQVDPATIGLGVVAFVNINIASSSSRCARWKRRSGSSRRSSSATRFPAISITC
jgi:Lrp/AsnC family leucine-responsive transcriptional regulator